MKYFIVLSILLLSAAFGYCEQTAGDSQQVSSKQVPPTQYYLSDPLFTNDELKTWLKEALTNTFSFDDNNYKLVLSSDRQYFTLEGYEAFLSLLDSRGTLDTVVNKQVELKAFIEEEFDITQQQVIAHKYTWVINTSLSLFFQGDSQAFSEDLPIQVTVERATPSVCNCV